MFYIILFRHGGSLFPQTFGDLPDRAYVAKRSGYYFRFTITTHFTYTHTHVHMNSMIARSIRPFVFKAVLQNYNWKTKCVCFGILPYTNASELLLFISVCICMQLCVRIYFINTELIKMRMCGDRRKQLSGSSDSSGFGFAGRPWRKTGSNQNTFTFYFAFTACCWLTA